MKVIQVGAFFHPSVGGVERQMEELAVNLKSHSIEVEVFTTDATHGREKRMQRLNEEYRGIKIYRHRYNIALGDFLRFSFGLTWRLLTARYDIIHVHNVHDGHALPAILIRLLRRKRIVFTGHNPYVATADKRGGLLHKLVRFYDFVFYLFSWGIDAYIALLPSEKATVVKLYGLKPERVRVIPNGIQEVFYEPASIEAGLDFLRDWGIERSKWKLVVGTVSRLTYIKGIQNLKLAADKLHDVLFIFAGGDDGYYDNLRKLYRENQNVLFTQQYIPSEEVKKFYQAIDIFLLPSLYEPFGMTIVEAMAQGKPVLASSEGGPSELVTEGVGELIKPSDQQTWHERIKFYRDHPEEITKRSENAMSFAQRYRWPLVTEMIIDLYKKI